jgi:hypothetical protein
MQLTLAFLELPAPIPPELREAEARGEALRIWHASSRKPATQAEATDE